jgi:hypothetical protein
MSFTAHLKDKGIYAIAVIVMGILFVLVGTTGANAATRPDLGSAPASTIAKVYTPKSGSTLPPCATEEDFNHNCFWDAAKRGNGLGKSYVDLGGNVYYFPKYTSKPTNAGAKLVDGGVIPLCYFEDSRNCFFDSKNVGNRTGKPFINVNGNVYYVSFQTRISK